MYYDEAPKRFNLLSGLACGALLGAGIALLLAPRPSRKLRKLRRRAAELGDRTAKAGGRAARELGRKASSRVASLREAALERAAALEAAEDSPPPLRLTGGAREGGVRQGRVPRGAVAADGEPVLRGRTRGSARD